jgi:serine/threonine protein kinase
LLEKGTFKAKLCDFGFAREQISDDTFITLNVGTGLWMSPEVILGMPYNFKADVYSYGQLLFEIMSREKPLQRYPKYLYNFRENEFVDFIRNRTKGNPPPELLIKIALSCVQYEPTKRPNFPDILEVMKKLCDEVK